MRKVRMIVLALGAVLMLSVSAWGDVEINATNFPDEVFRSYVSSNFDTDSDNVLSDSELENVTEISVSSMGITTLEGVEYFTALIELYCNSNQLTELDVSYNTALTKLDCSYNQLTELNVSHNFDLTELTCSNNQVMILDVNANTALTYLVCDNNQLTALDPSNNVSLDFMYCYSQARTVSLDKTGNTSYPYSLNLAGLNASLDIDKVSSIDVRNSSSASIVYDLDSSGVVSFASTKGMIPPQPGAKLMPESEAELRDHLEAIPQTASVVPPSAGRKLSRPGRTADAADHGIGALGILLRQFLELFRNGLLDGFALFCRRQDVGNESVVGVEGTEGQADRVQHFPVLVGHEFRAAAADIHQNAVLHVLHRMRCADEVQLRFHFSGNHPDIHSGLLRDFPHRSLAVLRVAERCRGKHMHILDLQAVEQSLETAQNLRHPLNTRGQHLPVLHIGSKPHGLLPAEHRHRLAIFHLVDIQANRIGTYVDHCIHKFSILSLLP